MKKAVIDASALLAFVNREAGSVSVQAYLSNSLMSSVNYAEVLQKLGSSSKEAALTDAIIRNFGVDVVAFDRQQALQVATTYPQASKGISFADRACLSLALQERLPVISGDRRWMQLKLGLEIRLFRESPN